MNGLQIPREKITQEGFYNLLEFRKFEYDKIEKLIYSIFEEAKKVNDSFEYSISKEKATSPYTAMSENYQIKYIIDMKYANVTNKLVLNIPELLYGSFFVLSDSYYIPVLALERLPLDKNNTKHKTFITLNLSNTFFLYWEKVKNKKKLMIMFPKNRSMAFEAFAAAAWVDRPEYIEELKEMGIIEKDYPYNKIIKEVCKTMELYNKDVIGRKKYFSDFMNEHYLLPYHKALFKHIYGVDKFEDILYEAIKLHLNEEESINLSDIRNRRLVFAEYLLSPLFSYYYRLINIIGDSSESRKITISNMNANSIISIGFRQNLHGKQLYDISTPFSTVLKYKMTQKISIIQKKIPQAWTELHDTHYGIIDPLAINPGESYGASISGTNNTLVDEFGLFWIDGPQKPRKFRMSENKIDI